MLSPLSLSPSNQCRSESADDLSSPQSHIGPTVQPDEPVAVGGSSCHTLTRPARTPHDSAPRAPAHTGTSARLTAESAERRSRRRRRRRWRWRRAAVEVGRYTGAAARDIRKTGVRSAARPSHAGPRGFPGVFSSGTEVKAPPHKCPKA